MQGYPQVPIQHFLFRDTNWFFRVHHKAIQVLAQWVPWALAHKAIQVLVRWVLVLWALAHKAIRVLVQWVLPQDLWVPVL